jgi:transposase-like protein
MKAFIEGMSIEGTPEEIVKIMRMLKTGKQDEGILSHNGERPNCKRCNSPKTYRKGKTKRKGMKYMRWICHECGFTYTLTPLHKAEEKNDGKLEV